MAEKLKMKDYYKQKEKEFVEVYKSALEWELQLMKARGEHNAKETKDEYDKKFDLLQFAEKRPAEDTFDRIHIEEVKKAEKEKYIHDYDNMNSYDIMEKIKAEYEKRGQEAQASLEEINAQKSCSENIQNSGVPLEPSNVVGIAKSQGLKAEIAEGFSAEIPNNVTPELVDKYIASREQTQGRKQ